MLFLFYNWAHQNKVDKQLVRSHIVSDGETFWKQAFFQSSYFFLIFEGNVMKGEYVFPRSDISGKMSQI